MKQLGNDGFSTEVGIYHEEKELDTIFNHVPDDFNLCQRILGKDRSNFTGIERNCASK